jgi:aminopeptidase YwaD
MDWRQEGVDLLKDGIRFEAFASPYSPGCSVSAPLAVTSTLEELEAAQVSDKILLMCGELAQEQLMPKNFPFYNPEGHQHIIQQLESKKPLAIIAATSRDAGMAGGLYPFPLFEDGDFDISSVFMTDEEGARLAKYTNARISLDLRAQRTASQGCNVIARKGAHPDRRVVFFAHIDAKVGTPGAIDNAAGVIVMMLLAELLADYSGDLGIEIVALNGEDYYSNPGEQQYLAINAGKFDPILLGINVDGAGYCRGKIAYSLYDCAPEASRMIREVFSPHKDMMEGEPWYQGDHVLFLMNHRPAVAITSELVGELMAEIIHTPQDRPEIVDPARLVTVAHALRELVVHLESRTK